MSTIHTPSKLPNLADILPGPQADAIIAALRLLQSALSGGLVSPDDGDIGAILTNAGEHEGLTVEGIDHLLANAFAVS